MFTRRTLFRSTLGTTAALVFSAPLTGLRAAIQETPPRRRSLGEMHFDDPDLETYREFVTQMKDSSRSGTPVNWVAFSNIHGNRCPHTNWYFLPWHRGYLRMYEVAIRSLTGNQRFALPYWDWTADRQMPRAFTEPTLSNGQPNPLFVSNRVMGSTDSLPDDMVGPQVMDGVYDTRTFEAFGSTRPLAPQTNLDQDWIRGRGAAATLEANPHNRIHGGVGGFMGTFDSPQDPLFLMHHCNVDRIWTTWNSDGWPNSSDPLWLNMPFSDHFIAPDGTTYTDVVAELQNVVPLGYTYGLPDTDTQVDVTRTRFITSRLTAPEENLDSWASATPSENAEWQRPLNVLMPNVSSPALVERSLNSRFSESVIGPAVDPPAVYAVIHDLAPTRPDTTELRVFVNCDYLSQEVPPSDPHYVTTIGFFGAGEEHTPSALVNLTPALTRLTRGGRLDTDEIVVQLLPVPQGNSTLNDVGTVVTGEVELGVL